MPSKRCTKCGEEKPHSEFHKASNKKDGIKSKCKACCSEYGRQYRKDNAEAIRQRKRQYHLDNADAIIKKVTRWAQENAEARKEYKRQYYKENYEAIAEYKRQWERDNPDKKAAYSHARRARKAAVPSDGIPVDFRGKPCYVCGAPAEAVDHIVPLSKGGHDTLDNKAPICHSCNSAKGAYTWPGQPDWDDFLKRRRNQ